MERYAFCRALARDAGKLAHRGFGLSASSMKGRHDIVTAMDHEVERYIRAAIGRDFPEDAIIGEEEGGSASDKVWVIDPIDGTANYARGNPRYCVSIAFVERNVPVIGVLYDPSHDALYAAAQGDGAYCDGVRLAVSSCTELSGATVECGWSTRRSTAAYVDLVARVLGAGSQMQRTGSGAMGLADVAAGRVEGYCELHINAWDCAAGIVLVREAGGVTNDFFAGDGLTVGAALLATNAGLYAKLANTTGIAITS